MMVSCSFYSGRCRDECRTECVSVGLFEEQILFLYGYNVKLPIILCREDYCA